MNRTVFRRAAFRVVVLVAACILLSGSMAHADNGPRQVVRDYMEALKSKNYIKALQCVGIDLPPSSQKAVLSMLDMAQQYVIVVVKDYRITDVRQDGGLALITVRETQFRDINTEGRAMLAKELPYLNKTIVWGDNVITERFVLVRLEGKWQFDSIHSGFPLASTRSLLLKQMGPMGPNDIIHSQRPQQLVARLINTMGIGQLLQSVTPYAPIIEFGISMYQAAKGTTTQKSTVLSCEFNLKNIGTALEMYSTDNSGRYPTALSQLTPNYLRIIPTCPQAHRNTYSQAFVSASNPDAYTVICQGSYHDKAGLKTNFPQYTSVRGLINQ